MPPKRHLCLKFLNHPKKFKFFKNEDKVLLTRPLYVEEQKFSKDTLDTNEFYQRLRPTSDYSLLGQIEEAHYSLKTRKILEYIQSNIFIYSTDISPNYKKPELFRIDNYNYAINEYFDSDSQSTSSFHQDVFNIFDVTNDKERFLIKKNNFYFILKDEDFHPAFFAYDSYYEYVEPVKIFLDNCSDFSSLVQKNFESFIQSSSIDNKKINFFDISSSMIFDFYKLSEVITFIDYLNVLNNENIKDKLY